MSESAPSPAAGGAPPERRRARLLAAGVCGVVCLICLLNLAIARDDLAAWLWQAGADAPAAPGGSQTVMPDDTSRATGLRLALLVAGAGASLLLGIYLALSFFENGQRVEALRTAPARDLRFPDGEFIAEERNAPLGDAGAYIMRAYGTDADDGQIAAFFDRELAAAGYAPGPPTPDDLFRHDQDKLLRQYTNGPFTYRLYLLPAQTRVLGKMVTVRQRRLLYTRLTA